MPSKDADTITTKETAAVEESQSSEQAPADSQDKESIDLSIFNQILEMDDDSDREFSRAIVDGFKEQAEDSFLKMELFLGKRDLNELSSLGHFLKGSSATLGLVKVQSYCTKIQNLGSGKDESGAPCAGGTEERLAGIKSALGEMKKEYERVRVCFEEIYDNIDGDPSL